MKNSINFVLPNVNTSIDMKKDSIDALSEVDNLRYVSPAPRKDCDTFFIQSKLPATENCLYLMTQTKYRQPQQEITNINQNTHSNLRCN